MPGEPRDILRLKECPECGYDLTGLPAKHSCPECGFAYDASTFVLNGHVPSRIRDALRGALAVIMILAALGVAVLIFYRKCAVGRPSVLPALIAFFAVPVLSVLGFGSLMSLLDRRRLRAGKGNVTITIAATWFSLRKRGNDAQHFLWSDFSDVSMRQISRSICRIRYVPRDFNTPRTSNLTATIAATNNEAGLIRDEVCGRIKAARAVSTDA